MAGILISGQSPLNVPGALLAETIYSPASNSTLASRSNTALADADATNLAVSFTAPVSGLVDVALEALCSNSIANQAGYWGLREATTNVTLRAGGTMHYVTSSNTGFRCTSVLSVSGLTGGNSYTYKWAIASDTGSGNVFSMFGGDANWGPAIMRVFVGV